MFNKLKCLLIGYGNIAKIHSKYLNLKFDIEWYWYDPFIDTNHSDANRLTNLNTLDTFDKVFILTPERTHYSVYKEIRKTFNKDIFVEKPAIIDNTDLDMLDDPKLFVGLVERYNPAIDTLKQNIDVNKIINLDFSRCCVSECSTPISVLQDISIHDIDLFFYLTDLDIDKVKNISMYYKQNTISLQLNYDNVLSRFLWSKNTFFKERKLIIRQTDCTYIADLQEQSVIRYLTNNSKQSISESLFVEKGSPINTEQNTFLYNKTKYPTGKQSHKLLLKLIHNDY